MNLQFRNRQIIPSQVPNFVPKWMVKPDRLFDPERALRGAVRCGDTELAKNLIRHFDIHVDEAVMLKVAGLNGLLCEAVDALDLSKVKELLDQGASPNAAIWNDPGRKWFHAGENAHTVWDSPCYSQEQRKAAGEIFLLLKQRGYFHLESCLEW